MFFKVFCADDGTFPLENILRKIESGFAHKGVAYEENFHTDACYCFVPSIAVCSSVRSARSCSF